MINLRRIDLNLLVVLDVLLRERHVTRAAGAVGLSQPAMSSALARLRHLFKDELLVRTSSGMQLTARGEALIEPVRHAIGHIERVIDGDQDFDAKASARRFTVRLSDLLGYLILPRLLAHLARAAPGVGIDVMHLSPLQTVDALEKDRLDVAVSMGLEHTGTIRRQVLVSDRMVCVMRKSHPLGKGVLTRARFLSARHLKVSMSPTDLRFVDDVLAKSKVRRDVALNVPHWLLVPHVLQQSDLVSVMPELLATSIADRSLIRRELPFASAPFDWCLYWHRRHQDNPANRWLREALAATGRELAT